MIRRGLLIGSLGFCVVAAALIFDDLKEERDVGAQNSWVAEPVVKIIGEFEASLKKYPLIKIGTSDPYTPPVPIVPTRN
jgi:hypothetical protein